MKHYGIFLGYSPSADLRAEGLGRHLASFLAAAFERDDVKFTIACPSWTRKRVIELCAAYRLDTATIDFIGPKREPVLLRSYQHYLAWRRRPRKAGWLGRFVQFIVPRVRDMSRHPARALIGIRSPWLVPLFVVALAIAVAVVLVADGVTLLFRLLSSVLGLAQGSVHPASAKRSATRRMLDRLNRAAQSPSHNPRVQWLFELMEEAEIKAVMQAVARRKDIAAWYCPAPFWPQFNAIDAPRLQCVPDVVLAEFPVGFAHFAGERVVETFHKVERTIAEGDHFVTYSDEIRQRVLLDRYHVADARISVIAHGTDRLGDLVRATGFPDNEEATNAFCRGIFGDSLKKSIGHPYPSVFAAGNIRFLFYASQFRPNKNLRTLLRAFDELLRHRHLSLKLVLTGDPREYADFGAAVDEYRLRNDVLCLHGLSARELAACYRLAQLAICPSLSEGGMPFTFAEAVSVGTPVVMSDIGVTREIIVDPALRARMLFDPYDAMAIADSVEAALADRDSLYALQRRFFDTTLAQRGWDAVVAEHIDILDRIASNPGERRRDGRGILA